MPPGIVSGPRAAAPTIAGDAWNDNMMSVGNGHHGGEGFGLHRAAVTGGAVGAPCANVAEPAADPMTGITDIAARPVSAMPARP